MRNEKIKILFVGGADTKLKFQFLNRAGAGE